MISELFLTTVISTAAAAAGTVAFALLFGVPRRFFPILWNHRRSGLAPLQPAGKPSVRGRRNFFRGSAGDAPFQILCRA